jgi:hypothetical protein
VDALAEAQRRTEERVAALAERVDALAEAQRRTEEQVAALAEAQRRTEQRLEMLVEMVRALAEDQRRINDTVGDLKGRMLELTYRDKAGAYFGPLLRRLRVVEPHTLEDTLEAHLTPDEVKDVLRLDLLVSGRPRYQPNAPQVWLAVEISGVIDQGDVRRVLRRASLLRQAGYRAIPAVAGAGITQEATDQTSEHQIPIITDGSVTRWDEALQVWMEPKKWEQFETES